MPKRTLEQIYGDIKAEAKKAKVSQVFTVPTDLAREVVYTKFPAYKEAIPELEAMDAKNKEYIATRDSAKTRVAEIDIELQQLMQRMADIQAEKIKMASVQAECATLIRENREEKIDLIAELVPSKPFRDLVGADGKKLHVITNLFDLYV